MKKLTYSLLNMLFILSILATAALPFSGKLINLYYNYTDNKLILFIVLITISGAAMAFLLYNLKTVYKTFADDNPFIRNNVKYLTRIALNCAAIMVVYIVKIIFIFTPAACAVVLLFGCCSLLAVSLRDLFIRAVEYKEENDLTI